MGKESILYFFCSWIAPNSVGGSIPPKELFLPRNKKRLVVVGIVRGRRRIFLSPTFGMREGERRRGGDLGVTVVRRR